MAADPLALDDLPGRGARWFGVPVKVLRIELADGRHQRIELPAGDSPEADDEPENVTEMEAAVFRVVTALKTGESLTTQQIADRSGHANSGHLRYYVQRLAADGHLRKAKANRGWTKT